MIAPSDLTGVEQMLALRIIAMARSIAPCLDSLTGDARDTAIAILVGIAGEAKLRGSRLIKSQRIGPASVEYTSSDTWFSGDDRAALRSLCAGASSSSGPVGRFPRSGLLNRLWPEEECI